MTVLAEGHREDFNWLVWAIHTINFLFWSQSNYPQQMDVDGLEPVPMSGPEGRGEVSPWQPMDRVGSLMSKWRGAFLK